jgi:hypothetical protein
MQSTIPMNAKPGPTARLANFSESLIDLEMNVTVILKPTSPTTEFYQPQNTGERFSKNAMIPSA